ncbi:MAG: hypothetical protein ACD_23C00755G0007 [uncultured bacterium]|jgi:hypothetical protein|nr:MAG: hypothetical protein ACD_23C00755G0007 [uncultured bacterium]
MPTPSINNLYLEGLEVIATKKRPVVRKSDPKPPAAYEILVPEPTPKPTSPRLSRATEFLREKTNEARQRTQSQIEQRVLQGVLPLWDDDNRGVPNPLVRSGLFTVGNSEKREYVPDMLIASLSNYEIRYTGAELRQDDLSVWLSLVNLARAKPMSEAIYFTGYQIVKDLGWRMHSESYKRVQDCIERLKVTGLKITTRDHESAYSGSLIRDYGWTERDEKGNTKWMVRFEPRISSLFMEDTVTLLEWDIRKKIGPRSTLALWLLSFYSTHRAPEPNSLAKIHELCRSKDTLSSFRRNVRNALAKLVEREFLKAFNMDNDMLKVEKRVKPKLVRSR